jgi:hypothetical protein
VQLKPSIALGLACVVAGCAQNKSPRCPSLGRLVGRRASTQSLRLVRTTQNVIPEPPPRPDDKSAIALDCSGLLHGWNNCMLTASSSCGSRGYTILDRSDQYPAKPEDFAFARSMHIRCNS